MEHLITILSMLEMYLWLKHKMNTSIPLSSYSKILKKATFMVLYMTCLNQPKTKFAIEIYLNQCWELRIKQKIKLKLFFQFF